MAYQKIFFSRVLGLVSAIGLILSLGASVALAQAPGKLTDNASSAERYYKKKIVVTAFFIHPAATGQIQDIDDIAQGFPNELVRGLEQGGKFLGRRSPNLLAYSSQSEAPSFQLLRQMANENDAQFVVSGTINFAGTSKESKYWGLVTNEKRHIQIDVSVFDAVSGSLIAKKRVDKVSDDNAPMGRDLSFGSAAFYTSPFGRVMRAALKDATSFVEQELAPLPMMARILKISDQQVFFDAGASSLVAQGDLGVAIAYDDELPVKTLSSLQANLQHVGLPLSRVGSLNTVQVFPNFSVAELGADTKRIDLDVGDFVRFDQRRP